MVLPAIVSPIQGNMEAVVTSTYPQMLCQVSRGVLCMSGADAGRRNISIIRSGGAQVETDAFGALERNVSPSVNRQFCKSHNHKKSTHRHLTRSDNVSG